MRSAALPAAARRLAATAASLLLLSLLLFGLLHLAPGSALTTLLGPRQATPDQIAALTEQYALDEPFLVQYWTWLSGVLRGDLGSSIQSGEPVTALVGPATLLSVQLAVYALVIVLAVGVPSGLVAGLRAGRGTDRAISAASVLGMSAPAFAVGLFLIYLLGVRIPLFPVYGPGEGGVDRLVHLTLPAVTLATGLVAVVLRQTRAGVVDVAAQDYVTFARARRIETRRIHTSYVLRNAAQPVIAASGLMVVLALSSAVLVETVFSLPGLGSLLVRSVTTNDVPLVQGVALVLAALVLLVTMVVDVLGLVLDPRLRHAREDL